MSRCIAMSTLIVPAAALMSAGTSAGERTPNPVRKVVNLLQAMQKKVESEGAKAEELFEKFQCYCKTSSGDLQASISAAENKIPELQASIKAGTSKKAQLDSDIKAHQTDRTAAKKAMEEATALRQKEKAVFDKALADNKANYAAVKKATAAISQGMGGSFLQTQAADIVRSLVMSNQKMLNADRQDVLSFLSGSDSNEYAPASGEIVGILKQMSDEMFADQKDLISTEETAVKNYEALMAAKKKEVETLAQQIEVKMSRVGELGVEIATMKNDLEDTSEALAADQGFVADLSKNCADKAAIHEKEKKLRADEVVALAETIKILNSDDALDLFKSTLPSASSSFLQVQRNSDALRSAARAILASTTGKPGHHHVDFILLALRGRKVGFEKIVKLIDNLVATLKSEQDDDDHKKEYCGEQFDQADDKKKGLQNSISDLETVNEDSKESIANLAEEIKALKASISALDKQVSDATEQRQAESAEYKSLMKSNTAAKELILFAKNRMNKFYNPKMYKPAPKRELSEGDQIYVNQGGDIPTAAPGGISDTGITALVQIALHKDAPAPPPATADAYMKKTEESGGVIAMMDLLVKDLDEEMTTAETDEKNSQAEYKQTMGDAGDKRRQDAKSLTFKESAKADLQASLEESLKQKKETGRTLMGTERFISELHGECDWLLKYYDVRKEARADEVDSLEKAKDVLKGASYSFLQRA